MYDKPPETFDDLIKPFPENVQKTARWLRGTIQESF